MLLSTFNRATRETSFLSELLSPFSSEEFLTGILGQKMLYVPGGKKTFSRLFSWDELNRILAEHRLEPPRLRLVQKGVPPERLQVVRKPGSSSILHRGIAASGLLDIEALNAHLGAGATLVMDAVEQASPRLAMLCDEFARHFCVHSQVNAYATFGGIEGFGLHWDDHDVLIVQIAGRKVWRVFETTQTAPLLHTPEMDHAPAGDPAFNEALEAGDVLYLPRGWWHAPQGIGEPSLHLTIGLPRPTGADLLDWLMNRLLGASEVRRDLPRFGDAEATIKHSRDLKQVIDRMWDDGIVEQFLVERVGTIGARVRPCLPFGVIVPAPSAWADKRVCFNGVGYSMRQAEEKPYATIFTFAGHTCEVEEGLTPVIYALLQGGKLSISDLKAAAGESIDEAAIADVLHQLIALGVLRVEPE